MSARRSFDNLINDWLDEGPQAAPREDLAAVLDAIPRTRQRGSIRPWRIPMPTYARLAIAAALVVAVGAIALTQLPGRGQVGGPTVSTAVPTASAAQPSPTGFPNNTASRFKYPFNYAIDPASRLGIAPCCPPSADSYQFRARQGASGDWSTPIVVVEIAGALRQDYCHDTGGVITRVPTPQQFVDYFKSVNGLLVSELPDKVIDGRPAKGIDVKVGPLPSACGELFLFDGAASWNCCQPEGNTRRMYVIAVQNDLVMVTEPFAPDTKEANLAIAEPFVDSMHFTGG